MKKILTLLFTILCLTLLATPAMAIEGVDTLAIVGDNVPGVELWQPSDPAGEMEEIADGIFVKEITLTAGSTMTFKFAANDSWDVNYGGATVAAGETATMTQDGDNMLVTVEKDTTLTFTVDLTGEEATLLVEGDSITDVPEISEEPIAELETLVMVGEGLPTLNWDPSDPTNEMTRDGNIFTRQLGISAGTTIKFKFAGNGDWGSGYNFGSCIVEAGTAVQMTNHLESLDMAYTATEDCILKFTVDTSALADGGNATVLVEVLPPAAPPEISGEAITVYVDPFNDWTQTMLYIWSDEGEYAAWPGLAMSDDDGDGWYEVQVPAGFSNLIVSNDTGYQSSDLEMYGSVDVWVTMGSDDTGMVTVSIDYIYPGDALDDVTPVPGPEEPETMSIVGEGFPDLGLWDPTDPNGIMDEISDGIYVKELLVSGGSKLVFKFVGNQSWYSGLDFGLEYYIIGGGVTLGQQQDIYCDDSSVDITMNVSTGARFRFTLDLTEFDGTRGAKLLVEEVATETVTIRVHAYGDWGVPYCYPWLSDTDGNTTNLWGGTPGEAMTQDGDWYTFDVPIWCNQVRIYTKDGFYQSTDLEIEGSDLWIVIKDSSDGYGMYETQSYSTEPELEPEVEDVTVHVQVPGDWDAPHCWAWDNDDSRDAFDAWPGEPLTSDGDWYTIQIPGWCDQVIINANSGSTQTDDLEIEPGKEVWLVCTGEDSVEIYYEEPALEVPTEPTEPTDTPDDPADPSAPTEESVETESTYPKMTRPHDYDEAEKQSEKNNDSGSLLVIILIAVGAVVLIGGGVTLIVVLKKKKKA